MMEQIQSPHGQFRILTGHFFGRFFDTEAFAAPHDEMHHLLVQILTLLVSPGLFKVVISITRYSTLAWLPIADRNQAFLVDAHFFICLSMILTGFITVFEWDALFPDHKDFYNLTPLPVRAATMFFGKVAALSLFVLLFHIAINGIPTLLFPGVVLAASIKPGSAGFMIPPGEPLKYIFAHAASLLSSTLFVFTFFIAVRAVLPLLCPAKLMRTVSRNTQVVLIVLLLGALLSGSNVPGLMRGGSSLIFLLPPFWFLGLYEWLIGHNSLLIGSLAKTACTAVAISSILSIVTYAISYRSSMQKGFQSPGLAHYPISGIRKIWGWVLHSTVLKNSMERALFHFVAQTVFRRQEHIFYWSSFVAIGVAFIYSDLIAITGDYFSVSPRYLNIMLSFPLIVSFFILAGLRFVFSVPADLNANWIFRIIDKQKLGESYSGVHKFMLCVVIIPLLIIFAPFYLMIWDFPVVFGHIYYAAMLSLILTELLLLRLEKLPFTCSYLPGKTCIQLWLPLCVLACYLYSYGTTILEQWLLADAKKYAVFIIVSALLFIALNRYRVWLFKRNSAVRFEETPLFQLNILSIED